MNEKKTWEEFRDSGLLWWINMILHTFGWAIAVEMNTTTQEVTACYPVRTKFRGFNEGSNTEGYTKVSEFMKDNAQKLYEESLD